MSSPATDAPRSVAARAAQGPVALIASEGRRELIAEILTREGLGFRSFDCVKAIVGMDECAGPSTIVLWLENTISSVPGFIQPLRQRFEQVPVVVACARIQRWEVRAALAAGVAGIVVRDDLDSSLGPCLRVVRAGQICVPKGHWRQIEPPALSTRERQILGLVAMGYMNSQIAERLFLAESTIKSHLSSAFGKLGVRSRNEAVELILDPERGLAVGILGPGGERMEPRSTTSR